MKNIQEITEKLLNKFRSFEKKQQIKMLLETQRSIFVLKNLKSEERMDIYYSFHPVNLFQYLYSSLTTFMSPAGGKQNEFIHEEMKGIFSLFNYRAMKKIITYLLRVRVRADIVEFLPDQYLIMLVQKAITKLKVRSWKTIEMEMDDAIDSGDYNSRPIKTQKVVVLDEYVTSIFTQIDYERRTKILANLDHNEMETLFKSVVVTNLSVHPNLPNDEDKMPFCILLGCFDRHNDERGREFVEEVVKTWSLVKIKSLFYLMYQHSGLGYDVDRHRRDCISEMIIQSLPLPKVKSLMGKNDPFQFYKLLSAEQVHDLKITKSSKVQSIKYEISELGREKDISKLTEKEEFELLTALVN